MALYDGDVADRYARAYSHREDDRKERDLDEQSDERAARLFVDPDTGVSATGRQSDEVDEFWEEKNG